MSTVLLDFIDNVVNNHINTATNQHNDAVDGNRSIALRLRKGHGKSTDLDHACRVVD